MNYSLNEATKDDTNGLLSSAVTNTERLRAHLTPNSLAVALLSAWKKDDPAAQARMLEALNNFHKPK